MASLISFTPRDLIPVTLDKSTVFLYPKITEDMNDSEKQYGLLVIKSALDNSTVKITTKLAALGQQTESSTTVSISQARINDHAKKFIVAPGQFIVESYHRSTGTVITQCSQSNGKLKSVDGQSDAHRRPDGMLYAKLSSDIDFKIIDPNITATYPFTFFIRLQQETRVVQNNNGQNVTLTTFFGPDDWATSSDQSVIDAVIAFPNGINKPFDIEAPAISTDKKASAIIQIDYCVDRLENLALQACWDYITKRVFAQVCPNVENDPISVIQEFHQVGTDSEGTPYELTVEQYYKGKLRLINFLPKLGVWALDVTQDFITHAKKEIREELNSPKSTFRYSAMTSSKESYHQMDNLQKAFSAALAIEKNLGNMRQMARDEFKSNHAFMANFSLADKAMKDYGKKLEKSCWGCGEKDHSYAERGIVVCPNKDKPGVAEKAAQKREEFNKKRKARKDKQERRMHATVVKALASLKSESDDEDTPSKKSKSSSNLVLMMHLCLNSAMNAKPALPIPYNVNLPHIILRLGDPSVFTINMSVAFDTLAVLNVGNADFHLKIAKRYPQLVKSLIWAKDQYSPLTLSGVVSETDRRNFKPTTELPAVIEYKLADKSAQDTSATFKIAIGKGVGVNTLIGFAMIKAAKFSLDLENDLVTTTVLKSKPMKITYKPVQLSPSPDFSGFPEAMTNLQATCKHVSPHSIIECYNTISAMNKGETEPEPKRIKESKESEAKKQGGKNDDDAALGF